MTHPTPTRTAGLVLVLIGSILAFCGSGCHHGPYPPPPPPSPSPTPGPTPSPTPEPTPTPVPTPACPENAPDLDKIKLEGRRQASLIVDGTDFVHDAAFCAAVNGRLDCPFGDESPAGFAQRQACEAKHGPYSWSFNGIACDLEPMEGSTCWLNFNVSEGKRNPLQIRVAGPATIMGVVQVCAADGRCWISDCSFDSPVCVAAPTKDGRIR